MDERVVESTLQDRHAMPREVAIHLFDWIVSILVHRSSIGVRLNQPCLTDGDVQVMVRLGEAKKANSFPHIIRYVNQFDLYGGRRGNGKFRTHSVIRPRVART